jgi:polysaccharide export outer membrane protein
VVTTPKGDAAQFYSSLNALNGANGSQQITGGSNAQSGGNGSGSGGNATFYFNGLKVDSNGDVNIFGIGYQSRRQNIGRYDQRTTRKGQREFLQGNPKSD